MGEHVAAIHTATNALQALGRGFDVNFDTRLLYCKGVSGSRVVEVDEEHPRDMCLYGDVVVENVSRDIGCSQEPIERQSSGVYSFQENSKYRGNRDRGQPGAQASCINAKSGEGPQHRRVVPLLLSPLSSFIVWIEIGKNFFLQRHFVCFYICRFLQIDLVSHCLYISILKRLLNSA